MIFSPDGMSFDEYFDISDNMSENEKLLAFAVGLAPAGLHLKYLNLGSVSLKNKTGPSFVAACHVCSAFIATSLLHILLNRKPLKCAPRYAQFDPYTRAFRQGYLAFGNRHPAQQLKRWYLRKKLGLKEVL